VTKSSGSASESRYNGGWLLEKDENMGGQWEKGNLVMISRPVTSGDSRFHVN
jgi:hypothetical protein